MFSPFSLLPRFEFVSDFGFRISDFLPPLPRRKLDARRQIVEVGL
jgi:hypothetical protein